MAAPLSEEAMSLFRDLYRDYVVDLIEHPKDYFNTREALQKELVVLARVGTEIGVDFKALVRGATQT